MNTVYAHQKRLTNLYKPKAYNRRFTVFVWFISFSFTASVTLKVSASVVIIDTFLSYSLKGVLAKIKSTGSIITNKQQNYVYKCDEVVPIFSMFILFYSKAWVRVFYLNNEIMIMASHPPAWMLTDDPDEKLIFS